MSAEGIYAVAASNLLWNDYLVVMRATSAGLRPRTETAERYEAQRFLTGVLDLDVLRTINSAFAHVAFEPFLEHSAHPDYLTLPVEPAIVERLNSDHRYQQLTGRHLWAIWSVLESLRPLVSEALGAEWRVLNVRGWDTPARPPKDAEIDGPNSAHLDGMPLDIHKIMVYLTPAGPATGGIEMMPNWDQRFALDAPAGGWILFHNSTVTHRALAPTQPGFVRRALEITIVRSMTSDIRPNVAGLNSRHPFDPWMPRHFEPLPSRHTAPIPGA